MIIIFRHTQPYISPLAFSKRHVSSAIFSKFSTDTKNIRAYIEKIICVDYLGFLCFATFPQHCNILFIVLKVACTYVLYCERTLVSKNLILSLGCNDLSAHH